MQEIADSTCIHLVPVLSGTHTCLHLLFTDKVSIFEMSNYIHLFVLKYAPSGHESTHFRIDSSFINTKKNRNAHFWDYTEFKRLKINSKVMDWVKLVSL